MLDSTPKCVYYNVNPANTFGNWWCKGEIHVDFDNRSFHVEYTWGPERKLVKLLKPGFKSLLQHIIVTEMVKYLRRKNEEKNNIDKSS